MDSKVQSVIERHKHAVRHEADMRARSAQLATEAANTPNPGKAFQALAQAQRCSDRAIGAMLRASDIEEELLKMAEKHTEALEYAESYLLG